MRSCGKHLRVISQWILHISFLGVSLIITNFRLPPLSQGPMSSENGTQNVTQIPNECFVNICDRVLPLMHYTLISYWCFFLYITACFIVCFSCFYHIYLFKTWWNKGGRTINNITSIVITRIWGSITIILHLEREYFKSTQIAVADKYYTKKCYRIILVNKTHGADCEVWKIGTETCHKPSACSNRTRHGVQW